MYSVLPADIPPEADDITDEAALKTLFLGEIPTPCLGVSTNFVASVLLAGEVKAWMMSNTCSS